jgi:hypothetical protein
MLERSNGKTLTANEMVLQKLKEPLERNGNVAAESNGTIVWVLLITLAFKIVAFPFISGKRSPVILKYPHNSVIELQLPMFA